MLKVLHIDSGTSWRGGQKQLSILIGELAPHGVESHVAIPADTSHRHRFSHAQSLTELPMRGLAQLSAARSLARLCRDKEIDLLHVHTSQAHTIAVMMKAFARVDLPLIVHRHVIFMPHRLPWQRFKYSRRLVDHYIAISFAVFDALRAYGVAADDIALIRTSFSGPQLEQEDKQVHKQALAKAHSLSENPVYLGYCGALSKEKGCTDLLQAVALLRQRGVDNFHLLIAGDGPLRQELGEEVERRGLAPWVSFLGFVEDSLGFLTGIDLLAFPSHSEALGLSLLEAGVALCPVVASHVGGIGEVVIHEKTGLLFPPRRAEALADALQLLLGNPLLRLKYALNLRAHVRKNFSAKKMGKDCAQLYHRVIDTHF